MITVGLSHPAGAESKSLTRDVEEVVVSGQDFTQFVGFQTDRIHLYRYNSTTALFEPIPFQIDRRKDWDLNANCAGAQGFCLSPDTIAPNCEVNYDFDTNGNPVVGTLQSPALPGQEDEVVFLAKDSGDRAPDTVAWTPGNVSAIRYEIQVNDVDLVGGAPQIVGKGWVYAFLFLEAHAPAYPAPHYVDWLPNTSPDPEPGRDQQECITGDNNSARGLKSCGLFKKGPQFDGVFPNEQTYELRYLGHWIINRFWMVAPGASSRVGELIDRFKFRAGGQEGETEEVWSFCGCARLLGLKVGPIRTIFYAQGAASGVVTTRTDLLYPTHLRSTTRFRVHRKVRDIMSYVDYLSDIGSPTDAEIFVEASPSVAADTINGIPVDQEVPPKLPFPGAIENWTQVNTSIGRFVKFFKEVRPIGGVSRSYHYEDDAGETHVPEFQAGAFGNHGELFSGPTPLLNDPGCFSDPNHPQLNYAQLEMSGFVAPASAGPPTAEAVEFAGWMARPLRYVVNEETRTIPRPPPPPGPVCPGLIEPSDPGNGRFLDVKPDFSGPCSDSTVAYTLYRAVGLSAFSYLAQVPPGTSYRDWQVHRGQTYRYLARPTNSDGVEGAASPIVLLTATDNQAPDAPTDLVATAWDQSINLQWTDPGTRDIQGYNLYLATTSGGPYTKANPTLIGVPATSFTATGLQGGTPYYAVLRSVDFAGNESPDSQEVSATPGP